MCSSPCSSGTCPGPMIFAAPSRMNDLQAIGTGNPRKNGGGCSEQGWWWNAGVRHSSQRDVLGLKGLKNCTGASAGTEEPWVTCVGSFTPVLHAWRVGRRHSWQRADAFLFLAVPHCPKNPRNRPQAERGCALWQQDGTHTSGCCFPLSWLILHPRAWMQFLAWGRSPAPHCITSETGVMLGGRAGLGRGGDSCITAGKAKTQHLFGFFN